LAVGHSAVPGFGQADLTNCEREQIHLAGSIQPHGVLLVLREPDLVVLQASRNASVLCGVESVLGRRIDSIPGDLGASMAPHLGRPIDSIPFAVRCRVGYPAELCDALVHRTQQGLIVEIERAGKAIDLSATVGAALDSAQRAPSLKVLCDESARIFRAITGYDRVMVYRFDDEGHGEVYSECRADGLEAYLGNRYPASDIPQIARRLYLHNRVRVLVDVDYAPVPLEPARIGAAGEDLDMSLCCLRSMSPIHIQYLKNMGVAATLVASLVVGGRLWGLVSCHHYAPRLVHYEVRAVCELLAEIVSTRIAALESFLQAQAELSVRRLEQRMVEAISRDGDWKMALFDGSQTILQPVDASGAALLFEGQVLTAGEVPDTKQVRAIGAWLDSKSISRVFATAALGIDEPRFAPLKPFASGLLAAPISKAESEWLLWFRPEQVRTVTWGGNPFKPVTIGDDPADLSPRRSFSQWHQLVEGTSESWSHADLAAAKLIGESVGDVVHQFRSVRMLIARDQVDKASRLVGASEQPVIIMDPGGQILLTNDAFNGLVRADVAPPRWIEDLTTIFVGSDTIRERLRDLLNDRRPWRGEVDIVGPLGSRPFLVRADPVLSSPERVLGFVLLFTDLTERKAADAARARLQEGLLLPHGLKSLRLDSDLAYRNLLNSIVDNAQLAALEISDGLDPSRMPEMLESVRSSVARTTELLEHLVRFARQEDDDRVG
jgi:chemotaxis family two-component system sensor kinase Cph1